MKKLLVALLILISTLAYAKTTLLGTHSIEIEEYRYAYQKILCIDGYKYLLTYTKHDYAAVSTIQMFQGMGGYTVPISCKNK
jgi:hypothetical protein